MRIFLTDRKVKTGGDWVISASTGDGTMIVLPETCQKYFTENHLDPFNSIFFGTYHRFGEELEIDGVVIGGLFFKQVMDGDGQFGSRVMAACYNEEEKDVFMQKIKTSLEWSINWQKRNTPIWCKFYAHMIGYVFFEIDTKDEDFIAQLIPSAQWTLCDNGRLRYYFGKRAESVDDYKGRFKDRE